MDNYTEAVIGAVRDTLNGVFGNMQGRKVTIEISEDVFVSLQEAHLVGSEERSACVHVGSSTCDSEIGFLIPEKELTSKPGVVTSVIGRGLLNMLLRERRRA